MRVRWLTKRSLASAATDDEGTTLPAEAQYAAYTYVSSGTIMGVAHPAVSGGLRLAGRHT
jgi:hypothetical protein